MLHPSGRQDAARAEPDQAPRRAGTQGRAKLYPSDYAIMNPIVEVRMKVEDKLNSCAEAARRH